MRQKNGNWKLSSKEVAKYIENHGLMIKINHWILKKCLNQLYIWQSRGIMMQLSVNISFFQLIHTSVSIELLKLISLYRIKPNTFILEITESYHINDLKQILRIFKYLCNAGISIVIDDFNIGCNEFYQFKNIESLPICGLKISKDFIKKLPQNAVLLQTIIQLAHRLNLKIIADGVNTQEQLNWLTQAGVEYALGFLFSCAIPTKEFERNYIHMY